jgi:ADP-ribose pyrophosphatase YjhB (NUDIX family)
MHSAIEVPGIDEVRPGVAAVIRDADGRLLLHRRRVGTAWAPVSGHVEAGESVTASLHREVREETGLTVTVERFVGVYSDPAFQVVTYPDGKRVQFVTSLFLCRVASGTFSGSAEGLAWGWFSPGALPHDLLPYAEGWIGDALGEASATLAR